MDSSFFSYIGDSPFISQLGFQDPAMTTMEKTYLFKLHLLFVIVSIILLIAWLLVIILSNFTEIDYGKPANLLIRMLLKLSGLLFLF